MARNSTSNRFSGAGQALVKSENSKQNNEIEVSSQTKDTQENKSKKIKDKVITAKVYPETWEMFTAINRAQGMSNNSVVNMLISEYVRNKKEILKDA